MASSCGDDSGRDPVSSRPFGGWPGTLDRPNPEPRPLAKPNYSFEKRLREIAKKKKKEEKLARKQEARDDARPADPPAGEQKPQD